MEFSSPLAAMQPSSYAGTWGCRRGMPAARPKFSTVRNCGNGSFNFNELSMKSSSDYFAVRSIRGSSPAASLAADLSQNFHIDQTPQVVTPRRSLFTSGVFKCDADAGTITPPIMSEEMTTPPILSSSPYCTMDAMDVSPLPHKAPFSVVTELPSLSTSADTTPVEDDLISPSTVPPYPAIGETRVVEVSAERVTRRLPFPRPSLSRTKNYSTNTVSLIAKENAPLPSFKFSAGIINSSTVSSSDLDECFASSPPQERKPITNAPMAPIRTKQLFANVTNISRTTASPSMGQIRKPAGPHQKRPAKFRRSLSMYEHPGDVMKQKKEEISSSNLQAVMDVDDAPPVMRLPNFIPDHEPDSLPRVTDATLVDVLNGNYDRTYDKIHIIDCRFEFEFKGGHIDGALNYCDKEQLGKMLFKDSPSSNIALVFHCEFSAHRAPLMARAIRQMDRTVNAERYPHLSYPEMYILDGGYSTFYSSHQSRCYPQSYLPMAAKEHEHACERGMGKLRERKKLARAQTFAFGQKHSGLEDSPTAQGRSKSSSTASLVFSDRAVTSSRMLAKRMASY